MACGKKLLLRLSVFAIMLLKRLPDVRVISGLFQRVTYDTSFGYFHVWEKCGIKRVKYIMYYNKFLQRTPMFDFQALFNVL